MSEFKKVLDADTGDVANPRFLEIPISGPGDANRLVMITGVAIPDADISEGTVDLHLLIHGDIFIKTDYRLRDADKFLGIVDGNKSLLAATYVSLASLTYDEEVDEFTAAVDSVDTSVDTDGRIQIHLLVGLQGDTTLHRIGYQANILVQKAG